MFLKRGSYFSANLIIFHSSKKKRKKKRVEELQTSKWQEKPKEGTKKNCLTEVRGKSIECLEMLREIRKKKEKEKKRIKHANRSEVVLFKTPFEKPAQSWKGVPPQILKDASHNIVSAK